MKKSKLKNRNIIIISVLVALIIIVLMGVFNPKSVAAFNGDYPSEEEYNTLKVYAMDYAKTLDNASIKEENIYASYKFEDNSLFVIVDNSARCKINAEYPLRTEITNEGVFVTTILFEEAKYEEISYIKSISYNITLLFFVFIGISCLSSILIFEIHEGYLKIKEQIQST